MNESNNWQDEAVKDSGVKVPEWELEPTGAEQTETFEASVGAEPSVAEKRLEELAAETKEVSLENPEQRTAQVETMRAEIAEMSKHEVIPENEVLHPTSSIEEKQYTDTVIKNYLGKNFDQDLTKNQIKIEIHNQSDSNTRSINNSAFKTIALPATIGVVGSLSSWIAASSGVALSSATIAGLPLMTALAVGLAPAGAGIAAVGGAVWLARRLNNWRKRERAYNAAEAM